jgi:hypothetical protein
MPIKPMSIPRVSVFTVAICWEKRKWPHYEAIN